MLTIQWLEEAITVSMFQTQRLDFRNAAAQSNLFCSQGGSDQGLQRFTLGSGVTR